MRAWVVAVRSSWCGEEEGDSDGLEGEGAALKELIDSEYLLCFVLLCSLERLKPRDELEFRAIRLF